MDDGTWDFTDGPSWDPDKRYNRTMKIDDIIKTIASMESFLMTEAYTALINDKIMDLYPNKKYEKEAVQDMIDYYCEREEYEKCAKLVKYLKKGKTVA